MPIIADGVVRLCLIVCHDSACTCISLRAGPAMKRAINHGAVSREPLRIRTYIKCNEKMVSALNFTIFDLKFQHRNCDARAKLCRSWRLDFSLFRGVPAVFLFFWVYVRSYLSLELKKHNKTERHVDTFRLVHGQHRAKIPCPSA